MDAKTLKIEAARAALDHVENGMRLGIGTGSTANEFIRLLAAKVADGLRVTGVPTPASKRCRSSTSPSTAPMKSPPTFR
jgi:ribose 5-phosphate isomerase A